MPSESDIAKIKNAIKTAQSKILSSTRSSGSQGTQTSTVLTSNLSQQETPEFTLAKNYLINLARGQVHQGIASVAEGKLDPAKLTEGSNKSIDELELPDKVKSVINKLSQTDKANLDSFFKKYYSQELNNYQDLLGAIDALTADERAQVFKQHTSVKTEYDSLMNKILNSFS